MSSVGTGVVRTSAERYDGLPDFAFEPHYVDVDGLRVAYIDEGEGQPVLMLHGQPTWSFMFRKLIPPLRDAGFRCVAIDYVGFGRSDKPTDIGWYSYDAHTEVCQAVVERLALESIVLLGHDWGGPIGLRMAVEQPQRFDRYVLCDTPFFTGRQTMPPVWLEVRALFEREPDIPIGELVQGGCKRALPADVLAAYEAPYEDVASKAGARAFPLTVLPLSPELPAARACWRVLKAMRKDSRPTLVLWGSEDVLFPVELGQWVAGALRRDLPILVPDASHFLPEDRGDEVARLVLDWLS